MNMAEIGSFSLLLAFAVAIFSALFAVVGDKTGRKELVASSQNGVFALFALLTIASASLIYLLLTRDFSIKYVASNTSRDLPTIYTITAFWAGQSGSLLLWAWLLSIFSAVVIWQNRKRNRVLMPYVTATLMSIAVFFTLLLVFVEILQCFLENTEN